MQVVAAIQIGAITGSLAILAFGGWVDSWAAAAVAALNIGIVGVTAMVLKRDVASLIDMARRVEVEPSRSPPTFSSVTLLESLDSELQRLARRLSAHALRSAQDRLADTLILERLPDPVIVLTSEFDIRRANAAARQAFGADLPAVLRHPSLRSAIGQALTGKTSQIASIGLAVPVPRDLVATVVPIDPPLADGGRVVVVLSDRTRERLVEQMREDFVANVSHELRTPLASVIGFVETLRGPAADDRDAQQHFLGIMAEQGARMNRLIDDLLSLSRIELTEHQPPAERLDLAELLPRLVAGFEPRLRQRNATIDMEIEDGLPETTGDADQIAQVVQNLLENAVKYGKDGGTVYLTAKRAEPGSNGQARQWPARAGVVLTVRDNGAGIAKVHLPRLTERFYRVDKGRSRAAGGTGLGLAIVKHIVNRHRGQLTIDSEVDVGTTISVWLPLGTVPPP